MDRLGQLDGGGIDRLESMGSPSMPAELWGGDRKSQRGKQSGLRSYLLSLVGHVTSMTDPRDYQENQ